jgi:threonine/homoserine/homoserine lactone efflux protein
MPAPATLLLFALAAGVLVAIPGPNHIYIVTRSIAQGRRMGLASAFGVETGTLVHISAATVGLSALIAESADPARGATSTQILVLGLVVFAIATTTDIVYALAAGALGGWLRGRPAFVRAQRYLTACICLGLAAAAQFVPSERRRS